MEFLESVELRPRAFTLAVQGLSPTRMFLGEGSQGLEIVVFSSQDKPGTAVLHKAHRERRGGRASPILVVVVHKQGVSLCGTGGDQPPIFHTNDVMQAERLCESALLLPDRNAAIRFLADAMPSLETTLPGITNEGLLSLHELTNGTRKRGDWLSSVEKAKNILGKTRNDLISALGFSSTRLDNLTELLTAGDERTALAVLLNDNEIPEISADRFNNVSPVSYALTKADKERLPWVVMVQGDRIRIYNTKNIGVGRRGRTETYVECQSSLLSSDDVGLLWLLFSADALKEGGTIDSILEESKRFAADIADRLRERIYDIVVPQLAMGISRERNLSNPTKEQLSFTYQMALTVLFRLLFIAYAEDRDLLPYKNNEAYRRRSLKQKSIELAKAASNQTPVSQGDHHWSEINLLWKAVFHGNLEWGVPAYDGTIFSSDEAISPDGAAIAQITLPNTFFEEALRGLLLIESDDSSYAPVDFRSLSVREFGTIYEGLLASELSLARQNLTMDKKGIYRPAKDNDPVIIEQGEVYLHDQSGARKSSGSYYTPDFAVEHLLDGALEPALDEHLERIEGLDEADRTDQFFDFRAADIAMGSGHFLVAAIDRIERRFALWLDENPTPGITRELQRLRTVAKTQLGELADSVAIEDGQILRRMIARRCIYGVDYNPITVQLAQLSIWIHTFVPGLPLSLLDHNLVHGNSLVGVGSLDEIRSKFDESAGTLFEVNADELVGQAAEPLIKLARLSDASVTDIAAGRELMAEARLKTLETEALCDLITAQPVSEDPRLKGFAFDDWDRQRHMIQSSDALRLAREILDPLTALHFPIAFPEVFLGRSKGFDVLLGNPPWEKLHIREDEFFGRYLPEVKGLSQREREKIYSELKHTSPYLLEQLDAEINNLKNFSSILLTGPYPGVADSHIDLFKVFLWRFWAVSSSENGTLGLVLPRSAFSAAGSTTFRKELFNAVARIDIVNLQNTRQWIFKIHPQYTISLTTIFKSGSGKRTLSLKGPIKSQEQFSNSIQEAAIEFNLDDVFSWNDSLVLPQLPTTNCAEIFIKMREIPDIITNNGTFKVKAFQGDFNSTTGKKYFDLESETSPQDFWPVYKGSSFDIWNCDTGDYYAWFDPNENLKILEEKYQKSLYSFQELDRNPQPFNRVLMPFDSPRIAFRKVSRGSDSRTMRVALVPPKTIHTDASQFITFNTKNTLREAFILGVLSSIPLDWYARKFVETNFNFFMFYPLPIPEFKPTEKLVARVIKLSGRLAASDKRFAGWAESVGVSYGFLEPEDKQDKIYELDALVAHLYGLSEPQLTHIFETFHQGWSYENHLSEVLKYFHAWSSRI